MNIDAVTFRSIARTLLPPETPLPADEAAAIIHAAQLAAGADFDEDADEHTLLRQLERYVCGIADIAPESVPHASPLPLDDEETRAWIARLVGALRTPGADELAYVVTYLVAVADLAIAPVEESFVEQLRLALGIDRDRAGDLVVTVSSMLTPTVHANEPVATSGG